MLALLLREKRTALRMPWLPTAPKDYHGNFLRESVRFRGLARAPKLEETGRQPPRKRARAASLQSPRRRVYTLLESVLANEISDPHPRK